MKKKIRAIVLGATLSLAIATFGSTHSPRGPAGVLLAASVAAARGPAAAVRLLSLVRCQVLQVLTFPVTPVSAR